MTTWRWVRILIAVVAAWVLVVTIRGVVTLIRERGKIAAWEARADSLVAVADSLRIREVELLVQQAGIQRRADSLLAAGRGTRERVVRVVESLPPLPPQPAVCDACVQRVVRLEALLETAGQAAAELQEAAELDSTLAADRLVLFQDARRARDSLADLVRKRPAPLPAPRLSAFGRLEGTLSGPAGTIGLQRGDLYAGSRFRFEGGDARQEWVIGLEKRVRLW